MKKVSIIMGSISDKDTMSKAWNLLEEFGIEYEKTVISAHRAPEELANYAKTLEDRNVCVVIAGAGGAAHLPGVIASMTTLPVIGVPIQNGALNGLDALYAIVQMPSGIPVATVAINGSANAAILAAQMLSLSDSSVKEKLKQYKEKIKKASLESAKNL